MLPRYDLDGHIGDQAPLSQWNLHSSYATRDDCERVRRQMLEIANEFIFEQERRAELDGIPQAAVMLASKCVST
jgi:hypothetical protein